MSLDTCQHCGAPIKQKGAGRPARYCSPACRVRAHREAKNPAPQLEQALQQALTAVQSSRRVNVALANLHRVMPLAPGKAEQRNAKRKVTKHRQQSSKPASKKDRGTAAVARTRASVRSQRNATKQAPTDGEKLADSALMLKWQLEVFRMAGISVSAVVGAIDGVSAAQIRKYVRDLPDVEPPWVSGLRAWLGTDSAKDPKVLRKLEDPAFQLKAAKLHRRCVRGNSRAYRADAEMAAMRVYGHKMTADDLRFVKQEISQWRKAPGRHPLRSVLLHRLLWPMALHLKSDEQRSVEQGS